LNESVENFTKAMKLGSNSPEIFSGLSLAYLRFKNYPKALFYNDNALKYSPKEVRYLIQRSDILVEIKKFSEAINFLT
jgi:tetratricopeptide (TPR) repeat protein